MVDLLLILRVVSRVTPKELLDKVAIEKYSLEIKQYFPCGVLGIGWLVGKQQIVDADFQPRSYHVLGIRQ